MTIRAFSSAAFAAFALAALGAVGGCHESTACSDSDCVSGNSCVTGRAGDVACRLTCDSQDGAKSCPLNYFCAMGATGTSYCEKEPSPVTSAEGTWGALCTASEGTDSAECDAAQGFQCYATSPKDGNAFCTRYNCKDDDECKGGYYCATVNKGPSASLKARTIGETVRVCLPRDFCATCNTDLDCPHENGAAQVCAKDASGGHFCTTPCTNDKGCRLEAACKPRSAQGETAEGNVCVPRAGKCKGSGGMCDPCKSDRDCAVGAVCTGEVLGNYNTEKFCTKPVGSCSECRTWFDLLPAGDLKSNMLGYGCVKPGSEFDFPPNQCIGLVQLGTDNSNEPVSVFGCYTPGKL